MQAQILDSTGLPVPQYWDGAQWVAVTPNTPMPTTGGGSLANPAHVQLDAMLFPSSLRNNSTDQLTAGQSFIGGIETVLSLQAAQIMIKCDTAYSYTINQYEDAAGAILVGTTARTRVAGVPTNVNVLLPGNYFQLIVKNLGGSSTTTLAIATTFGIMPTTDDSGRQVVTEPSISGVAAITVGAGAIATGRQLAVNCTVAGNITVTFQDGSTYTAPVGVGLTIFPWSVSGVASATATATYANMK
jgi:hypothetical protein